MKSLTKMDIESQVVSLPLAIKLKELGVRQESVWLWCQWEGKKWIALSERLENIPEKFPGNVAAFTVAELGEMLPDGSSTMRVDGSWGCELVGRNLQACNVYRPNEKWSEADARAKMLVYLIEHGIVRP